MEEEELLRMSERIREIDSSTEEGKEELLDAMIKAHTFVSGIEIPEGKEGHLLSTKINRFIKEVRWNILSLELNKMGIETSRKN